MKKAIIVLLLIFTNTFSFSQPLEKGSLVIDAAIGFPNLGFWKHSVFNPIHFGFGNSQNEIHKKYGQFILQGEYFLTDKVGIATSFNASYYVDQYNYEVSIYDGNTNQLHTQSYYSRESTFRYRIYVGPNFHVIRTDVFDSYFGFKAGIKKSSRNFTTNDPDHYYGYNYGGFELPVGLRINYGMRFFINEQIAFNAEFGIGGPIVNFGLSYKIF